MSQRKKIEGQTFNSWKVIKYAGTVNRVAFYTCECLECGTIHKVDGRNIRSGFSKRCRSCKAKVVSAANTGKMKAGIEPQEASFRRLYGNYRKGAKRRGINFDLTFEQFMSFVTQPCTYCASEPFLETNPLKGSGYSEEKLSLSTIKFNGIDRVKSENGYYPENCVPCCWRCNNAKSNMSLEEFKQWAIRLAKHFAGH